MAARSGPNLVRSGLILDLDIANRKSYLDALNSSFISTSGWANGQTSSVTGYNANESVNTENARVVATDPWGDSNVVWETRASEGNGAGPDGGWYTSYYNIDRTKLYRFSIWMRRTSSTSGGTFYFGLYGNGPTWGVARLTDGVTEGNPYWDCSSPSTYTQNQWYLFVGHCYPAGTTYTGKHPDSGYYDTNGTKNAWNGCNITNDVKMLPDTTQLSHRVFHYYCADSTTKLQFAYPRLDVCDGTEPTINELITKSPATIKDNSGYGNDHKLTGYYIPNSSNPRRFTLDGTTPQGFTRAAALNGATSTCTVVVYYKTTDTIELWAKGNQSGGIYLSASYGNDYYHSGVGTPTNYIDLQTVTNPATPINYRNGTYRMWEAKNVDFTSWTYFEWFLYGVNWYMAGDVAKIMVYNRAITADESRQNFNALRGRFGI